MTDSETLAQTQARLPAQQAPLDDWATMGKAFEGMCKAGLALTVGFSVAAAFCKMMDTRNVNVTGVVNKLAGTVFNSPAEGADRDTAR